MVPILHELKYFLRIVLSLIQKMFSQQYMLNDLFLETERI